MNDTGSLAAVVAEASTVSKPTTTPESTWVLAFCGPEASRDHHCSHLNELLGELARRARCRPGAGLLVPRARLSCPGTGALCPGAGALCRGTGIPAPGRSIPAPGRPKPVPRRRSRRPRAVTGPGAQGLRRDPAYGLRLRVLGQGGLRAPCAARQVTGQVAGQTTCFIFLGPDRESAMGKCKKRRSHASHRRSDESKIARGFKRHCARYGFIEVTLLAEESGKPVDHCIARALARLWAIQSPRRFSCLPFHLFVNVDPRSTVMLAIDPCVV